MKTKPLTKTAVRVYEAVRAFIADTGRSPTYEEIYEGSGVDPNTVTSALSQLEKRGKIVRPVKGLIAIPGEPVPNPPIRVKLGYQRRTEKRKRRCLDCGNTFDSEHAGNRVCHPCKGTHRWRSSQGNSYAAPGLRI